ncbi:RluA family pseudouridine synthase [Amphibiibacter pelophylacis]|uniref:RluA family pseudouridine synthase n=1 Tax=Amphibiibacter pelophylacis TaxID=1799477 RepID=A0ACC6P3C3_9BURK
MTAGNDTTAATTLATEIGMDAHNQRLDRVLVQLAPEFSRNHLQSLIERGCVLLDGVAQGSASKRVRMGQQLQVTLLPTAQSLSFTPEAMALPIVFEDDHLMVVNKPVGLVVHPAAGNWSGTLLNGLLAHHAVAQHLPRAGLVHRLDKDTSGLMVVAKTLETHTALARQIAAREVHRQYLALILGWLPPAPLSISAPIGRDPRARIRMAVTTRGGKPARTHVQVLQQALLPIAGSKIPQRVSRVRCVLDTGRTHQIRVHLSHKGWPLVGDALYGGKALPGLERQGLHAHRLEFTHPATGAPLAFEADWPQDLSDFWAQCEITLDATEDALTRLDLADDDEIDDDWDDDLDGAESVWVRG